MNQLKIVIVVFIAMQIIVYYALSWKICQRIIMFFIQRSVSVMHTIRFTHLISLNRKNMIDFIIKTENVFKCQEDYESYFGFERN